MYEGIPESMLRPCGPGVYLKENASVSELYLAGFENRMELLKCMSRMEALIKYNHDRLSTNGQTKPAPEEG